MNARFRGHDVQRDAPYQAIVVSHTHWDREWYQTFEQYRIRLVRLIDGVLDLLEHDPRFHFFTLDGQTIVLEDYLSIRPENEGRLRALVQSGRLLIGPWYVLPDEFLVSGEALVRNLMMGRKVGGAFGRVMDVGYVPDPFGHVAQLPQILAGFGIDSFIFSRGLGEEGETLGSEFLWLAPDGTAVLAVHQIGWDDRGTGYLNAASLGYQSPWVPRAASPNAELALAQLRDLTEELRRYARTRYLLLNNGCDHLEPQPELPDFLAAANAAVAGVLFTQGTFPRYVQAVRSTRASLAAWQGELRSSRYAPLLAGVFSARVYLKQENARAQRLLERWTEPFCAVAGLEGMAYPAAFIWRAWRYLLWNQPHDSICGCSVDQVHLEMMPRFAQAEQIAESFIAGALAHIANAVDTSALPAGDLTFLLFNPLGQARNDVAAATIDLPDAWADRPSFLVQGPDGRPLPCQIISRGRYTPVQSTNATPTERITVAFAVGNLPALGYRAYALLPRERQIGNGGAQSVARTAACATLSEPPGIENEYYRVVVRPDGAFDVTHKAIGRILAGLFALADQADAGDEYTFCSLPDDPPRVFGRDAAVSCRVVHDGPVVASLEVRGDWRLPEALGADRKSRSAATAVCSATLRVTLLAGVDRIDVAIDFDNRAADHRLRLLVPTSIVSNGAAAAGHFAIIERPSAKPAVKGWAEEPVATSHQDGFIAVDDGRIGAAIIATENPEYEAIAEPEGTTLALTLLRCVGWLSRDDIPSRPGHAGPGLATPGAQCPGHHAFRCALYVYEGSWQESAVLRRTAEHSLPPRLVIPEQATSRPKRALPPELSFMTVEGEGLVLSAIKRSEDSRWLVVRVYNPMAVTINGRLRCYRAIVEAALLRLDERELERLAPDGDGTLAVEVAGYKIVTVGLQLGPNP